MDVFSYGGRAPRYEDNGPEYQTSFADIQRTGRSKTEDGVRTFSEPYTDRERTLLDTNQKLDTYVDKGFIKQYQRVLLNELFDTLQRIEFRNSEILAAAGAFYYSKYDKAQLRKVAKIYNLETADVLRYYRYISTRME